MLLLIAIVKTQFEWNVKTEMVFFFPNDEIK